MSANGCAKSGNIKSTHTRLIAIYMSALLICIPLINFSILPEGHTASKVLWELVFNIEEDEISAAEFKSWMDKNGFEAFKWYWVKRDPQYWEISRCLKKKGFCLVMEERKTSSHIIKRLDKPIPLSAEIKLVVEYMVEVWPTQTDLSMIKKEDAALRIFLTADLDGKTVHLGLAASKDHPAGEVIASQREPQSIKYMVLDHKAADGRSWQCSSTPISAAFKTAFGKFETGRILALGLKSDGNDTGSEVKVWLRKLKVE